MGVAIVQGKEKAPTFNYVFGLKEYEEKKSRNGRKITRVYKYIEIKNVSNQPYVSNKLKEYKIKFGPVVVKTIEKLDKEGHIHYKYSETR